MDAPQTPSKTMTDAAKDQAEDVKKSLKEKCLESFEKGKHQFKNMVPSQQMVVMIGLVLIILSVFNHIFAKTLVAVIGMVMIMITFSGVKLDNLGKKTKQTEPASLKVAQA